MEPTVVELPGADVLDGQPGEVTLTPYSEVEGWEVCQRLIAETVREAVEQNKKPADIGREVAPYLAQKLEIDIQPRTIERRARRLYDKLKGKESGTRVPNSHGKGNGRDRVKQKPDAAPPKWSPVCIETRDKLQQAIDNLGEIIEECQRWKSNHSDVLETLAVAELDEIIEDGLKGLQSDLEEIEGNFTFCAEVIKPSSN